MKEKECESSPDGKHQYYMIKSGMNPVYGCKYCFKSRPKTIFCPHCGNLIKTDEGDIWSNL